MIYIIKDSSEKYISNIENIIVTDSLSYFKARKLFFEKRGQNKDFEIIIQKKVYFNLFLDFQEYKDVQLKEVKEIQEIALEPKEYFGSSSNLFEILLKSKELESGIFKKLKFQMSKLYFENLPQPFKKDFLELHPDKTLKKLVNCYVFSKYKEYNFNTLIGETYSEGYDLFRNNEKIALDFEEIKPQLKEYIETSNLKLQENIGKLSVFSEFNKNIFLKEVSGILNFEKKFYIKKLVEELNLVRNFIEIKSLLKNYEEIFKDDIEELHLLISDLETIFFKTSKETDWEEYFVNNYLPYNGFLEENIEKKIKSVEKKYSANLLELKKSIKNVWKNSRREFENFYLENYNKLQSSSERKGLDYTIGENKKYFQNSKKTLLIFIDCLRCDIWLKIKTNLEKKDFICQKEEIVYSSIPTVTSYCKKILYHGKKYINIESSDAISGIKELFSEKKLLKIESSEELLNKIEEGDIFLYEILDLDNFFHTIKDLDIITIETAIMSKINKLLNEIDKDRFNLAIMTDHGAIKLENQGLRSFPHKEFCNENGLEIENHGRYMKIYSKYFNSEVYMRLQKLLSDSEDFYLINRENMSRYYLPAVEFSKENYCYLIYKEDYYPKNTSEYNHGGISLEEVLIPFGIFNTDKKEFKDIEIEVKNNIVEKGKTSELKLLLKNSNEIENFKINLKYQNVEEKFSEIKGNILIQLPVNIDRTGEIPDILEISFQYEKERKEYRFPIEITVRENRVKEFNEKLKRSRSLL